MSEHLDWFDSLDIDDLLDVGNQTARTPGLARPCRNVLRNLGMTDADIDAIAEQARRNWSQMAELTWPIEPADTPGDPTP